MSAKTVDQPQQKTPATEGQALPSLYWSEWGPAGKNDALQLILDDAKTCRTLDEIRDARRDVVSTCRGPAFF
jgi:hypothetical protein